MLGVILLASLLGFSLTFLCTPITIKFAFRWGLVDDVRTRKHPAHIHQGIIPRAGGMPIWLGIFLPALCLLEWNKKLIGIFLGATLNILLGILDDKYDLSPYLRLWGNFLAALLVVGCGVGIAYITNPFGGVIHLDQPRIYFHFFGPHSIWVLADTFALVFIVWMTNMVNWSKGVPGQMPGIVAISALVLGLLSLRFALLDPRQVPTTILCFLTASAFLGFLPFNFPPQKIMPGYSGGALGGFMLAVLAILSFGKLATTLLVLAIPAFDSLLVILKRIISGKSPVWADRSHLHHKLLDLGLNFRQISLLYWLFCAILGLVALNLNSEGKLFALVLVGVVFWGGVLWLERLLALSRQSESSNGLKT